MKWLYDGSFEGFLSIIYESYNSKTIPDSISTDEKLPSLLDECRFIETDETNAVKVASSMRQNFSTAINERISHTFLCDDSNPERDLLLYIRLGFKECTYLEDYANPIVYAIHAYQRRVLSTLHKMNAYLRFEELDDHTLYAQIAPPRNVLPLMGKHFRKRLRGERFIIHDTQRSIALLYHEGELRFERIGEYTEPIRSTEEDTFKRLWKTFFSRVAIESRINLKLQQSHVPLKYRTYMSEFLD